MTTLPNSFKSPITGVRTGTLRATRLSLADWAIWTYLVLAIGRINELIPGLGDLPLAKVAIGLAILGAFQQRKDLLPLSLRDSPIARTAVWLLFLSLASVFFSVYKSLSLFYIRETILVVSVSTFLVTKLCRSWAHIERIALVLVVSGIPLAITALTSTKSRIEAGSSYDTNDLAYVLVTLLPIAVALGSNQSGIRRILLYCVAGFFALITLFTASRGGALGLGAVLLVLVFVPLKKHDRPQTRKKTGNRWVRNLLVLTVLVGTAWSQLPEGTQERIATLVNLENDYNLDVTNTTGRTDIWKRNAAAALKRPIGFGVASFSTVDAMTGGKYKAPHNSVLQVWVELGVLGLVLYLRMYWLAWKNLLASKEEATPSMLEGSSAASKRPIMIGFAIALLGNVVCSLFLSQAFSNLMWTVFGVIIAMVALSRPSAREREGFNR